MANYLAWYGKKRQLLIERERAFAELLSSGADSKRLDEFAELVRTAQIQALKSKRAEFKPSEKSASIVAELGREIDFWGALTVAELIDGYRAGKLRGHRATAVRRARL